MIEQLRCIRIFLAPCVIRLFPAIVVREQFLLVLGKIVVHVLRHEVMFVGQPERFPRGIDKFCARFAVRLVCPFDFGDAFADEGVRDDELRLAVVAPLCHIECVEKLLHVLSLDFLDVEAISLHAFARILALRLLCRGVECDRVRVVDEDQVVEAPVRSQRARLRSYSLLHVAVAAQTDHVLIKNFVLVHVEARRCHFCRHGNTNRVAHALTERARGAFHSGRIAKFRMSRRFGM